MLCRRYGGILKRREGSLGDAHGDGFRAVALLNGSGLSRERLVKPVILGHERREVISFWPFRADRFGVFAKIDQALRQHAWFVLGIDDRKRGILCIPFAGEAVTLVFIRVIALHQCDRDGLVFFDDRRRDFYPAIVG